MKLLVCSDSHRTLTYMRRAVLAEQPDLFIHLGDHEDDAQQLSREFPTLPLLQVCGNCDAGWSDEQRTATLGGAVFFLTHGHRYGVKYSLLRAELAAREAGANVLLFGHTHIPLCDWHNGLWIVNPGACGGRTPTYAVIEADDGILRPAIRSMDDLERIEKGTQSL